MKLEPKVTVAGAIEFLQRCQGQVGPEAGLLMSVDGVQLHNVAGIVSGKAPNGVDVVLIATSEAQDAIKKASGRPDKFDRN